MRDIIFVIDEKKKHQINTLGVEKRLEFKDTKAVKLCVKPIPLLNARSKIKHQKVLSSRLHLKLETVKLGIYLLMMIINNGTH